jgi:hypothetical protein
LQEALAFVVGGEDGARQRKERAADAFAESALSVGEALVPEQEGAKGFDVLMQRGRSVALFPALNAWLEMVTAQLGRMQVSDGQRR